MNIDAFDTTPSLSTSSVEGPIVGTPTERRRKRSPIAISEAVRAALNSALNVEVYTEVCLDDLAMTGVLPTKTRTPVIDRRVTWS